jgi:hypothetical protein
MSVTAAAAASPTPQGPSLRWDHARAVGTAAVVVPTVTLGLAAVGSRLVPDAKVIAGSTVLKTGLILGAVGLEAGLLHEFATTRPTGTKDGLMRGAGLGALAGATAVGAYYVAKPGWQSIHNLRFASGTMLGIAAATMAAGAAIGAISAIGKGGGGSSSTGGSGSNGGGSCQP